MKRESPSLLAALTVGVLANVLLRSQSGYWPKAGLLTAVFCIPLLTFAGWIFSKAWQFHSGPFLKILFAGVLFYTSVLEVLRFWNLAQRLYPGQVALTVVCLMTLLPVLYLRRISAISQTAHVVLCLMVLATAFMLMTVLPRLHVTNLQVVPLETNDFITAAKEQLTIYPEYLLPALWPQKQRGPRYPLLRVAFWAVAFDIGIHFMLELFYGAALPIRIDPIHTVARCGSLSVFNRLESLQLILWTMAITLKLALYLYAIFGLLSNRSDKGTSVPIGVFPLYFGISLILCVVLRQTDIQAAMQARNLITWAFLVLVGAGGLSAWLCKSIKNFS